MADAKTVLAGIAYCLQWNEKTGCKACPYYKKGAFCSATMLTEAAEVIRAGMEKNERDL